MREKLRDEFKEQFGVEPLDNMFKYVDFLELRIARDPKEVAIEQMRVSIESLEKHVDVAKESIENVFGL